MGDYVPFYFCSRSLMLYLIYKANHPELTYRGGQGPIIHMEANLHDVVAWANGEERRWAFTLSNAGAYYPEFRSNLEQLDEINWDAVAARKWSGPGVSPDIREGKQAEFLLHGAFPWPLVSRIGVLSMGIKTQVDTTLQAAIHRPRVEIRPDSYY